MANFIGAGSTGLRISPEHNVQDAAEVDPADVAAANAALIDGIASLCLAALNIMRADPVGDLVRALRSRFIGPVLLNTGFQSITTYDDAAAVTANRWGDSVAVGRPAIANPNLVRRWQEGLPLNEPVFSTFHPEGAAGYTDYILGQLECFRMGLGRPPGFGWQSFVPKPSPMPMCGPDFSKFFLGVPKDRF